MMQGFKYLLMWAIWSASSAQLFANSGVTVSWDANTESDLSGYKVHYGRSSRNYDNVIWVGNLTSYQVLGLQGGQRYYFAVTALDFSGNESDLSREVSIIIPQQEDENEDPQTPPPNSVTLTQVYNFPNPFKVRNGNTRIRYELQTDAEVTIEIMDVSMNLVKTVVKNEFKSQGVHVEDVWDGKNAQGNYVSNGVYFCNIRTGDHQEVIKIAVTR